jgi:hypothetical protein
MTQGTLIWSLAHALRRAGYLASQQRNRHQRAFFIDAPIQSITISFLLFVPEEGCGGVCLIFELEHGVCTKRLMAMICFQVVVRWLPAMLQPQPID